MTRRLWLRIGLVAVVAAISIFYLYPPRKTINLGLDLQGGIHLVLGVDIDKALQIQTDRTAERVRSALEAKGIAVQKAERRGNSDIQIQLASPAGFAEAQSLLQKDFPTFEVKEPDQSAGRLVVAMRPQEITSQRDSFVRQGLETIRNRIDQLGVSEPIIEEHGLGQYQILVQLPGVDDPARVKEIMQSTAMLEIRQVMGGPYPTQEAALQDKGGVDSVAMQGKTNPDGTQTWYVVSRAPAVSGKDLRSADPSRDENGQPAVGFQLTAEGGRKFYAFTSAHVKDLLGVVLDGKVQSVATIDEPIHDSGIIKGRFTDQEVKDQSMILRSGALPAGIKYLEERTVGPSLGSDSIRAGIRAAVIGMAAVLVFMLVYYRAAGINADIALILNLIILLGFLGFTGATLTLPGIAGVILTVGMGVDSNVLIFERIREELRNGKTPPSAVEQGFGHAWITIVDTHVTTIVSAVILFLFGTGPVKGFAVTLSFGLFANLFTAVFVSRVIFDWVLSRKRVGEALSI
jgi:preprotein translocase subunit SecD